MQRTLVKNSQRANAIEFSSANSVKASIVTPQPQWLSSRPNQGQPSDDKKIGEREIDQCSRTALWCNCAASMLTECCLSSHGETRDTYRPNRAATKFFRYVKGPGATASFSRRPIRAGGEVFPDLLGQVEGDVPRVPVDAGYDTKVWHNVIYHRCIRAIVLLVKGAVLWAETANRAMRSHRCRCNHARARKGRQPLLPTQHRREHDVPRQTARQSTFFLTFEHSLVEVDACVAIINSFALSSDCLDRFELVKMRALHEAGRDNRRLYRKSEDKLFALIRFFNLC